MTSICTLMIELATWDKSSAVVAMAGALKGVERLTRLRMPNHRVFCAGGATSSMKGLLSVMMDASPAPMTTRHRIRTQKLGATAQPTDPITHTANPNPACTMHVDSVAGNSLT